MARSRARTLDPPPFLASGASALLSRPREPGRPEWGAQRFAATRPAAVGARDAGHCPAAAAAAMISAEPLPAPTPPPPPQAAAAAMFSFLVPGPATAASGAPPLPSFKCPALPGACSRCGRCPCAGDSQAPRSPALAAAGNPFPSPLPPPLPSSSQSQSRRHLGSPLNSGARGHPGSSCRGGPLVPPFKETETSPGPQCAESRGPWRLTSAEVPRWRERRRRKRRGAGRTGDGAGLPRVPRTHCRASAGWRVHPSHPVFVISLDWGLGRGVEPASGGLSGQAPCLAWPLSLGLCRVLTPPSRVARLSCPAPGATSPGALQRRPSLHEGPFPAAFRAGLGHPVRGRTSGGARTCLTPGCGSSFGVNGKAPGNGHGLWHGDQPPAFWELLCARADAASETRNLGHLAFSGPGTKRTEWDV